MVLLFWANHLKELLSQQNANILDPHYQHEFCPETPATEEFYMKNISIICNEFCPHLRLSNNFFRIDQLYNENKITQLINNNCKIQ